MTSLDTEYKSEYTRALEAKGEAKAIVMVLESRGLPLSPEDRDRVMACTDLGQLEAWLRRVSSVATIDELFD